MKFDPTKFRLPGFFRRFLQNRQMKYVLLAVAFSALIIGAAVIYGELSKRYEQEIQPPVRTEQTMKTKPGTKVTNEKKTAETTDAGENTADSSLESAATTGPEKSLEKETERASGATEQPVRNSGEDTAPKPPTPGISQQQTNTEKPKDTEKPNNTENPAGLQSRNPECQIQNRLLRNNRKQPLLKQILPHRMIQTKTPRRISQCLMQTEKRYVCRTISVSLSS